MWLAARCGAGLGAPGGDRRVGEPDRQAAALPQGGVVRRPVRDPVPLLGDVVTTSGIGLERHGRDPGAWKGPLPYANQPLGTTRTDPCNKMMSGPQLRIQKHESRTP